MRLRAYPAGGLSGRATVPGDKSVSHRALMLAAMAVGESRIQGLLEGADVLATAAALRGLGVAIERDPDGVWRVQGVGVAGLCEPDAPLDLGNSGTGARLLLGLLAGQPFTSFMTGDDSLRSRPMARVTEPLAEMGATFVSRSRGRLPLAITGSNELMPIRYRQKVASAQVKSAILLAGLHAPGRTTVVEPQASRDHTERLLRHLGATVTIETLEERRHGGVDRGPAGARRGRAAGAGLRLLGGLCAGRRGARPGLLAAPRGRGRQPVAHRPDRDPARDGGGPAPGRGGGHERRAGDLARAGGRAAHRASTCRRSARRA